MRSIVVPEYLESSNYFHPGIVHGNCHHAVSAMGPLRVPIGPLVTAHDDGNLDRMERNKSSLASHSHKKLKATSHKVAMVRTKSKGF